MPPRNKTSADAGDTTVDAVLANAPTEGTTDMPMEPSRALDPDTRDLTDAEIDGVPKKDARLTADQATRHAASYMSAPHMTYGERTRTEALRQACAFAAEMVKANQGRLEAGPVVQRAEAYLKFLRGE